MITLPGGVVVEVIEPERIQSFWLKGQYYEQEMLQYIRKHFGGGTFIDCGACIGNHTLYFAKFCAEHVIAIEPVRRNAAHMRKNLKLSGLTDKVDVMEVAVGASIGYCSMEHFGNNHGQYRPTEGQDVTVMTIDQIADGLTVKLIKIDIEGSEIQALQGAQEVLLRDRPALFVELSNDAVLKEADDYLFSLGYQRVKRFNATPTYCYVETK